MYSTLCLVAVFQGVFLLNSITCQRTKIHAEHMLTTNNTELSFDYETLLNAIHKEKAYDSLLIIHQTSPSKEKFLEVFTKYQAVEVPRLTMRPHGPQFSYKALYNSEILVIILMAGKVDKTSMHYLGEALDYMRQTRILMVATNVGDFADFKKQMLNLCEFHMMTNVLLSYHNISQNSSVKMLTGLHRLMPYPNYHWQLASFSTHHNHSLYPRHWLNMHNKTLRTFPDQFPPMSFVYSDSHGQLHVSGFSGLLVLAFAEHYNAHLEMYEPLVEGKLVHWVEISQMIKDRLIDLPMSIEETGSGSWHNMSSYVTVNRASFMVPLTPQFTLKEIFALLLDGYFLGSVLIFSLLLSFMHTLTKFVFEGTLEYFDFVINSKVMPGVLGQSFVEQQFTHLIGLRMIYFFVGFVGLNISSQFSANIHSYFTWPPYHRQFEEYRDLEHSSVTILMEGTDSVILSDWVEVHENITTHTENVTFFLVARQELNTSHGYIIESELWDIYNRRQEYFQRKVFHVPRGMTYFDMMVWGLRLQYNSPYKEAVDWFILNAHQMGFMDAWITQTYLDMSKSKRVPSHDPNAAVESQVLTVQHLYWVWILLTVGWLSSFLAFLMELLIHRCCCSNKKKNDLKRRIQL
ncbi:uncharacterized protein LOC131996233 [Stomoxys calcitrans]|uniref:uncharacterized protein LOC131996233 n=1 Tax=Stomoxys calcitrans TaxID=35570 RepID=UPI0027E376A4|nr:uncharacterized protein LOC131996233 [Stomoxys calcitrans]